MLEKVRINAFKICLNIISYNLRSLQSLVYRLHNIYYYRAKFTTDNVLAKIKLIKIK